MSSFDAFEVHRLKARVPLQNGRMLLIQGVRNIYDTNEVDGQGVDGETAKLVFIGKGVDQPGLQESLIKTLSGTLTTEV